MITFERHEATNYLRSGLRYVKSEFDKGNTFFSFKRFKKKFHVASLFLHTFLPQDRHAM